MAYAAEYQRPYEGGYVDLPDESTPEMAAFINARDDALLKIEQFLATLDFSGDYALLSEAGYSLELGIDSNYVMTVSLKNKAGSVLSSKQIDFPIESMVVNATYENGKIILTLQNGNTLPIDISDMVRGLVPTTRKIAGIDLEDDITKEELKDALGISGDVSGEIPTKVSQLENDSGYVTQDDIIDADAVAVGEIKPWLYDENEEVVVGVYNGKPLYRKTIVYDCANTNFSDWFSIIDMTNYNVDVLVDINGIYRREYQNTKGKIEGRSEQPPSNNNGIVAKLDNDIIWCFVNGYSDILELYLVLEYTKTTDAEGSGNDLKPYGIYDAKLDNVATDIANIKNQVGPFKNITIGTDGGYATMADDIADKFADLETGAGFVTVSNGASMFHGTYYKYSNEIGSITFHDVTNNDVYVWCIKNGVVALDKLALQSDVNSLLDRIIALESATVNNI